MGLRFRRSISLGKGLRLNFGKTGMSISAGVKGFRKTYNFNTGKTTTTVGLPGTGVYYTTTDGPKKEKKQTTTPVFETPIYKEPYSKQNYEPNKTASNPTVSTEVYDKNVVEQTYVEPKIQSKKKLDYKDVQSICRVSDEKIDWFEILSSKKPTDGFFNENMWHYLHSVALDVCQGNIDTYLQVIQDINPYDDLLDYAENFEFGTDDAKEMNVSFNPLKDVVDEKDKELYEDYIAACVIRVARDTFALLPVERVNVEVEGKLGYKARFDIGKFQKIKFSYSDPSTIVDAFRV